MLFAHEARKGLKPSRLGRLLFRLKGEKRKLLLCLCILSAATFVSIAIQTTKLSSSHFSSNPKHSDLKNFDIANLESYKGLPVGKIKKYTTENSWGTVIFIPQFHRNPASSYSEGINDSAKVNQEEIYEILKFIAKNSDINLIMVEGELYGRLPAEKIGQIATKIENRNIFASYHSKLKEALKKESVDEPLENSLLEKLEEELAAQDREIILAGAPQKLSAEGENLVLLGSENKETLAQSRILVADFIYLQDRMNELNNLSARNENNLRLFGGESEMILGFLSEKSLERELGQLEKKSQLQGKEGLSDLIKKTKEAYDKTNNYQEDTLAQTNGSLRQNNPYQGIKNRKALEGKLEEAEKNLESVVVERRNQETAKNFSQALKENGKNTGILQFGAGHEEGLIQELQKNGLSVIVIVPNEVSRRNFQ